MARYGEGAIHYDETKRLWVGRVELGLVDGARRRKTVKAKTKTALLAKMRAVHTAKDQGLPVVNAATAVAEWLTFWSAEVLPGTVAPSTETNYANILNYYVIPAIGNVRLATLGPEHVQTMMRGLERRGLSPRTVGIARSVLRRALGDAERWGKVSRNAAALVRAPKKSDSKLDDALDADGATAVLQAAAGDRLEALAVLVLAVGLRQGEALGLTWADVDLDASTVTVVKAKTDAGVRTVALPAFVVAALKAHRARQSAERLAAPYWEDHGLVFPSSIGTRIDARNLLRWWHEVTIRAGVGRHRFHASRHTAATLMLNNGVPLEVVSATLGHAGLAITADIYAKVRPAMQRKAADVMEGVLGGA